MIMQSEQIDQIAGAIVQVQLKPIIIGKDTAAYKYKYATLDKCVERIFPRLSSNGLSILQPLSDINGEPAIATIIMHTSGQFITTLFPIGKAGMAGVNAAQDFGASISYARRYGLLSAFGIPTGEDDDAQSLNKPAPKAKKKPAGKKYESKDPTPAESIITDINNCTDIEELTKLYKAHEQTIMDSPKKDEIVSNFSIQKGFLEERGRK